MMAGVLIEERENFARNKPRTKEKGKNMKTNRINTLARLCGLTIALAMLGGATGTLRAGEIATAKGGASKQLELTGLSLTPKSEPSNYKPMSCGNCKDEYVSRVDLSARGAHKPTIRVAKHLCGSCANEWVVTGHGKAKRDVATHKCTSCDAESVACCSTSKNSVAATKGI